MRRADIEPGRFYEAAIERSGRRHRVTETDFVKVARIEERFGGVFAVGYRALMKGVVRVTLPMADVLRPAAPEETAKYEGYFALVREHGWEDAEAEDAKAPA